MDRDEEKRDAEIRTQAQEVYAKAMPPPMRSRPYRAEEEAFSRLRRPIDLSTIETVMEYQPWDPTQSESGAIVREALTAAAKAILRTVPPGLFRDAAIEDILHARMNANAAISFRGRF